MNIYCKNGICYDLKNPEDLHGFYIIQKEENYVHSGDGINYDLDSKLVMLYDKLRDLLFTDNDVYYNEIRSIPAWVIEVGQDSDCSISSEDFGKFIDGIEAEAKSTIFRHLYLTDCQFLIGAIQNALTAMDEAFIRYFITLSEENGITITERNKKTDGIYCIMSYRSRCAAAALETYFIKAYSILDILCKLSYELQNTQNDFEAYRKLNSSKILWGDRKRLSINGEKKTLYEKCALTSMIESLRNELVHNGTWELNPKIFCLYEDGVIKEKYMIFPDTNEGRLAAVKNRKHFFSEGIKVNDRLLEMHREFKERLSQTISVILEE